MNIDINGMTDIHEMEKIIQILKNKKNEILKKGEFPYIDVFSKSTNAGEDIEQLLCDDIFYDLERIKGKNYDQVCPKSNHLVETKLIRMMVRGKESYVERAFSITDPTKGYLSDKNVYGGNISTTTFQQVKPNEFDYLVGVTLFKNGMDIYLIPSSKISNPKERNEKMAYLSGQHKGNTLEGQLNYNDPILNDHYLFSVYNDGEKLYYYDRKNKLVGEIFTKLSIEKIIYEKFSV
jgi:hypothetical protein